MDVLITVIALFTIGTAMTSKPRTSITFTVNTNNMGVLRKMLYGVSARKPLISSKYLLQIAANKKAIDALTKVNSSRKKKCTRSKVCGCCRRKKDTRLAKDFYCDCRHLKIRRDCKDFKDHGYTTSGVYKIRLPWLSKRKPINVFCDQKTNMGGWTVIQRRIDGVLNFNRNWNSYKRGFGTVQHSFWLGNDNIHALTKKSSELRVEIKDWKGNERYAEYSTFSVGNERSKYKLRVAGYHGDAGDGGKGLSYHDGMKFSTFDKDNDKHSSDCAKVYKGGWWYKSCWYVNLNGRYQKSVYGIEWYAYGKHKTTLKFAEMKIRRIK